MYHPDTMAIEDAVRRGFLMGIKAAVAECEDFSHIYLGDSLEVRDEIEQLGERIARITEPGL